MKMLVHWGGRPEFAEKVAVDAVSWNAGADWVWLIDKRISVHRAWLFPLPESEIAPNTHCYVWDGDVRPEQPAIEYYIRKDGLRHVAPSCSRAFAMSRWDHAEPVPLQAPIEWKLIASKMDVIDWQSGLTIAAPIGLWKIGARGGDDTVIAVHHRPEGEE